MFPLIQSSDLAIGYKQSGKKQFIVHDSLQLQLFSGELTSLLGLNGAGKSTLLRTLCGFQSPISGTIRVKGRLLSDYSQAELSQTIGVVLTEKTNAGGISVQELVSLGRHPYTGFFGALKTADKKIVDESLEAVGMTHKSSRYVSELSDGERQKVMIAKVLAQQCPIILLDEPTAFLDVTNRIETMSLLHRLSVEQNKAVLLSTHDLDLAIQMSDRLWLMEERRPMENGSPEDLILSGLLETFFSKKGIVFDALTGKLTGSHPSIPVLVEGEVKTAYWVSNALVRNGFRSSSNEEASLRITCRHPNKIELFIPDSDPVIAGSVAELIMAIKFFYHKVHKEYTKDTNDI